MYEVIYNYDPQNKGDITLQEGDKVDDVKDVGCGWASGRNLTSGEVGFFPFSYVQSTSAWKRRTSFYPSMKKIRKSAKTQNDEKSLKISPTLDESKDVKVTYSKENEEDFKVPMARSDLYNKVKSKFVPKRKKNRRILKIALGFLAGLSLGAAIFVALVYSFHYSFFFAGIISGLSTLFMCVGLAFSRRCRCIVLLVIPSMASNKGRAAFLSIITGFLLMGPVSNITHNANEVAISMACITELAYNQSEELQKRLQEPLMQVQQQVSEGISSIKSFGAGLQREFDKVRNFLISTERKVTSTLNKFRNKCGSEVNGALGSCRKMSLGLREKCKESLRPLTMTAETADNIINEIKDFFGKKRKRSIHFVNSSIALSRPKRQLSNVNRVCDIFYVPDQLCGAVQSLDVCSIISIPANIISGGAGIIYDIFDAYAELLEVGVKNDGGINTESRSSQSAAQIVENIRKELQAKLDSATYIINIVNRVVSLTIVLLFVNAVLYQRKYLSKITFDNIYITSYFKSIDQQRKEKGEESVLPLKKAERKTYTDSRALLMSAVEVGKCRSGIAQVLLHTIICIMLLIFDYLLFFILSLLQKHGGVEFIFSGESRLNLEITGSGIIALFLRALTSNIQISQNYNFTASIETCLPRPREPELSAVYMFVGLYVAAFFFVFMQGYAMRLQHAIAAFFYPEKEQQRVNYLYRRILVKRQVFVQEAKQMILSNISDNEFSRGKKRACPNLFSRFRCYKKPEVTCSHCEETTADAVECKNKCGGVYCNDCFLELEKSCPLCTQEDYVNISEVLKLRESA